MLGLSEATSAATSAATTDATAAVTNAVSGDVVGAVQPQAVGAGPVSTVDPRPQAPTLIIVRRIHYLPAQAATAGSTNDGVVVAPADATSFNPQPARRRSTNTAKTAATKQAVKKPVKKAVKVVKKATPVRKAASNPPKRRVAQAPTRAS